MKFAETYAGFKQFHKFSKWQSYWAQLPKQGPLKNPSKSSPLQPTMNISPYYDWFRILTIINLLVKPLQALKGYDHLTSSSSVREEKLKTTTQKVNSK